MLPYPRRTWSNYSNALVTATYGAHDSGSNGNCAVSSLPRPRRGKRRAGHRALKSFDRGQVVLDQNVILRAIFLIEEGSVRVERQDRDQTIPLAILEAGEFFGEMSYVDGAPTSATGHRRQPDAAARDRRSNR